MPSIRQFVINSLKSVAEKLMLKDVTWSELVSLRDSKRLVKGTQYRITDYNTTTVQANTRSAGHQFDIIVTADDDHTLNENARACLHSGDTYFSSAGANLNTWELKYSLDNNTERFGWADSGSTGRGVIYWMKDDWRNECPYDFKNIQFKRYKITSSVKGDLVGLYSIDGANNVTVDVNTPYWCYTFSMINLFENITDDVSVYQAKYPSDEGVYYSTYDNVFKEGIEGDYDKGINVMIIPNNVFVTDTDICGVEDDYSYGEFYGFDCNTFGNNCGDNTFGNNCGNNTFGYFCVSNTFGNSCRDNMFGKDCGHNTFGNDYNLNTFRNNCKLNTFGNDCVSNTFGNSYWDAMFGNDCCQNTFGNDCVSNTFGNNIVESQFGDGVQYFSITTSEITTTPAASDAVSFVRWLIVENGVRYVNAYVTTTTAGDLFCQNVRICLGVQGTSTSSRLPIDITSQIGATANATYQPANSQVISV